PAARAADRVGAGGARRSGTGDARPELPVRTLHGAAGAAGGARRGRGPAARRGMGGAATPAFVRPPGGLSIGLAAGEQLLITTSKTGRQVHHQNIYRTP